MSGIKRFENRLEIFEYIRYSKQHFNSVTYSHLKFVKEIMFQNSFSRIIGLVDEF